MAYLIADKPRCVVLFPPKCATQTQRAALHTVGKIREVGQWHAGYEEVKALLPRMPHSIVLIRRPEDWYASSYAYWQRTKRFPALIDGPRVPGDDFETFVHRCLAAQPGGYVTALYDGYLSATHVGRVEDGVLSKLGSLLARLGRVIPQEFFKTPALNTSDKKPAVTDSLRKLIRESEHEIYKRFYPDSGADK